MNEEIKSIIKQIWEEKLAIINSVIQAAVEYFGEELVDYEYEYSESLDELIEYYTQNPEHYTSKEDLYEHIDSQSFSATIYIKFPNVRVTNEDGNSTDITNLFVKLCIDDLGRLTQHFYMTRTEVTFDQFRYGYLHSHLAPLRRDNMPQFSQPCLGQGPIRNTENRLMMNWTVDIDIWNLFFFELSKYVTVESLDGGPYRYLDQIGKSNQYKDSKAYSFAEMGLSPYFSSASTLPFISEFIKYLCKQKQFKFAYQNGQYVIAESLYDFWIKTSNTFFDWMQRMATENISMFRAVIHESRTTHIITDYCLSDTKMIYEANSLSFYAAKALEGYDMGFTFKGEAQKFHITGVSLIPTTVKLLDYQVIRYIVSVILTIININYEPDINPTSTTKTKITII